MYGSKSTSINPIVFGIKKSVFGFLIGIKGKEYSYSELIKIADEFKQEFLRLEEGAKVEIYGEQEKAIYLTYKKSNVEKYKLNSTSLKNYLEKTNIITSGGELEFEENRIKIYFRENFKNILGINEYSFYIH